MVGGMQPLDVLADFGRSFFDEFANLSRAQDLPALACEGTDEGVVGLGRSWSEGHGKMIVVPGLRCVGERCSPKWLASVPAVMPPIRQRLEAEQLNLAVFLHLGEIGYPDFLEAIVLEIIRKKMSIEV